VTTLVTGGTGSFGHAYVKRHHGSERIRVLSRDEEKQRAMAALHPDVEFVIGDIRDAETVRRAMRGVERVFHAAALKQVSLLEAFPMEAVRTNIIGTDNVCQAASDVGARLVFLSTDKAVEPVGVMGGSTASPSPAPTASTWSATATSSDPAAASSPSGATRSPRGSRSPSPTRR
jgi:UDP-N-acetylglucosamine 4,6-dehydratase